MLVSYFEASGEFWKLQVDEGSGLGELRHLAPELTDTGPRYAPTGIRRTVQVALPLSSLTRVPAGLIDLSTGAAPNFEALAALWRRVWRSLYDKDS